MQAPVTREQPVAVGGHVELPWNSGQQLSTPPLQMAWASARPPLQESLCTSGAGLPAAVTAPELRCGERDGVASIHHSAIPVLEEDITDIEEQLRQVSEEVCIASSEMDACLSGLPSTRLVIQECAENLHHARGEVGALEVQIVTRKACLKQLERDARCPGTFASELFEESDFRRHTCANVWLQRCADELEGETMALLCQCQVMTRDASDRTELERLMLQQDLKRREHRARLYGRLLEDCGRLGERLRSNFQGRIECQRGNIAALDEIRRRQVVEAVEYRDELLEEQRRWEPEREALVRDISLLRENVADMRSVIVQVELDEQEIERRRADAELSISLATDRAQELQTAVDDILHRAHASEQEVRTVEERRVTTERRSMEIFRNEWAQCSDLTFRLGAADSSHAAATDAVASMAASAVGAEARQAADELREAEQQVQCFEAALRDALRDLAQQQDMYERQPHSSHRTAAVEDMFVPQLFGSVA